MRAIKLVWRPGTSRLASRLILMSLLLFSFLTSAWGQVAEEIPIVGILRTIFPEAIIEIDPITGFLLVKAPPALQEKIEEMIKQADVYHPQITIEAKFVELTVTDIHELGIDLDIHDVRVGPTLDEGAVDIHWANLPAEMAGIFVGLTRLGPADLSAVFRALEEQGKVHVLSAPRVTTLSGREATINIMRTIPYITDLETELVDGELEVTWNIAEEEIGISLNVTPTVPKGSTLITLDITPTVSKLIEQVDIFVGVDIDIPPGLGHPVIDERTTTTRMTIESGETIVLGGLIRSEEVVTERKVPLLGDIPLLGHVFRRRRFQEEKTNLLIFITAYLLSPTGEKTVARR